MRILGLCLLLCAGAAVAADATHSFDKASKGVAPAGWRVEITGEGKPEWVVVAEGSPPSAPHALKQSGITPRPSFPLCVLEKHALRDGAVAVEFKTVSGEIDQAAGVIWRFRDKNNYYVCRANALENNVVLYKVANGKRTALDIAGRTGGYGVEAKVEPAGWQNLRVEFRGDRFQVFLSGALLFEVQDTTFREAGLVGLWTKADSVTLFDNFRCEGE